MTIEKLHASLKQQAINAGKIVRGMMIEETDPMKLHYLEVLLDKYRQQYIKYVKMETEWKEQL